MSAAKRTNLNSGLKRWGPVPLSLVAVLACAMVATAASYLPTSLRDLTTHSSAVAEVSVLKKNYPPLLENQNFPRTHVEVKVVRALKGALPAEFTLDIPGGIDGNTVAYVADAPDFKVGEQAIVFVKEPQKGRYMVQDLGLGKLNIVQRGGESFVESPLCPRARAVGGAKPETQEELEAALLTKSIPYATFCNLVMSYAAGKSPEKDAAMLAAVLPQSGAHVHGQTPAALADAQEMTRAAQMRRAWVGAALCLALITLFAALIVRRRRKLKAAPVSIRAVAALLGGSLLVGALGGSATHAFVQFDQKTIWDLDSTTQTTKIGGQKIIWKQSSSVAKDNANSFAGVQTSYDKWEAVNSSRLAFTNGGATTVATNDSRDTENVVAWTTSPSDDFSNRTLAICFSSFTTGTGSKFLDGDIIFNDRDFSWAPGGSGNVTSVSLHEIGHFIGLNHTTDNKTVMFPFDGGLTTLTNDEVVAAQTVYPGPADNAPAPAPAAGAPKAVADASPKSGPPGTTVAFTGSGSQVGPSGAAITAFDWDFGDGTKATTADASHNYPNVGTFTASLKVTDANGATNAATVEIEIGKPASVSKSAFKLSFKALGNDSFSVTLFADNAPPKVPKGTGEILEGTINIGDQPWRFQFDTTKAKTINTEGPKIQVRGTQISCSLKKADLRDVLAGHGAIDDNIDSLQIDVPVTLWFGEGKSFYIFGEVPFFYKAKAGVSGQGKF